ncbi:MAG: glycosyltransferase [Planctomycetota bacterium]|nr:glycosyltransferase [Planctomycetota bacterium]
MPAPSSPLRTAITDVSPRLAIDYTPGPGHAPGLGRYVRELVRALVRLEETPPLRLVELGRAPSPMEGAPLGLEGPGVVASFERTRLRLPRRGLALGSGLGDLAGRCALGGAALLHRTSLELAGPRERHGRLRIPHTIAVAEFPRAGTAADDALAARCRAARSVVVFSADAAARIASRYGVAASQVPVGCDHWVRDLPDGPVTPRPSRDVLVLGAVRASRRPLEVLRAFEALRASGEAARLLWVGRAGDLAQSFREAVAASAFASDVRWIEAPEERRMPRCVSGASVLLHLADDEATPVTPLEALRSGLPVVSNRLPAFQEALGSSARYVDASEPGEIAEALGAAISDRDRIGARTERASPYTWEASARAHLRLWEPMLTGRAGA